VSDIDLRPYQSRVLKYMVTGQSIKVPHEGCSDSNALSITMEVEGYLCYCFKCGRKGFLRHEDSSFRDRHRREAERAAYSAARLRDSFDLPGDATRSLDSAANWSDLLGRCIFRIQPAGYIARAVFNDQFPKYFTKAPRGGGLYWQSEPIDTRVCLTEDILSAGRVGQIYPAMAILGTDSFNWDIIMRCEQVLIWTDGDAGGDKARHKIRKVLQWCPDIQTLDIKTPKDPKAYTNEEIQRHLVTGGGWIT